MKLIRGLYEKVISNEVRESLNSLASDVLASETEIDDAEAPRILSQYLTEMTRHSLNIISDSTNGNLRSQVQLVNDIISMIQNRTRDIISENAELPCGDISIDHSQEKPKQLLAIVDKNNTINAVNERAEVIRPLTSIAKSYLFTGSKNEPQMYAELKREIISSDRIDMLVSFIKWSGLRLIIDELTNFTKSGNELRVITTSYMGATDVKAIEELSKLPNTSIKVSYDTKRTRLHAKTYVFYRNTGYSTAYIGSSNLSNAAISSGLEWNVKVTAQELPDTFNQVSETFEFYWNSRDFEDYNRTAEDNDKLIRALNSESLNDHRSAFQFGFDIIPYPYQQEILDRLMAERIIRNYYRNLVVAATGTGKTVISAFDYKAFCDRNQDEECRLLFVAHREEILKQSIACFRGVLKDPNFGELFVGSNRPTNSINHLFVSIQTFNSQAIETKSSPDYFDYIIIDEFHHAAANSYQKLLNYYQPKILLGLTATPERMDGKSILEYFDNRIAAEIRLPEAIDRKLLVPFQYFGVTDTVDLDTLQWSRGGYDKKSLENIYTFTRTVADKRAELIVRSIQKYVTEINNTKGLGFCVSVEHAKYMADYFNNSGIPAVALTGESSEELRRTAPIDLVKGKYKFIFVVDIYNEGVDIPEINTVLFLRPTESLTIFLQQLGRGLRICGDKECLTVLDFIGQANKKYNFEEKFSALLSTNAKSVTNQIINGFNSAPRGCYIQLEQKATEYILENIRGYFNGKNGIVSKIATFLEDSGKNITIGNFSKYYHLDIRKIYKYATFSRLCVIAKVRDDFCEALEDLFEKAFPRICAIDSQRWIRFLKEQLSVDEITRYELLSEIERKMLNMFQFTVWQKSADECGFSDPTEAFSKIRDCPTLCAELIELLNFNYDRIDMIDEPVSLDFICPLDIHCTYSRDQILVAFDFMKPATVREGVKWLPDKKTDVFFITLNKSEKAYSPTTMYEDYSINENLFHWQSQSTTSVTSPTGQRYINHNKVGTNILLFVREYKTDIAGNTAPYTFIGQADYVRYEGSSPINIVWKLQKPIPAKFIKVTDKLSAG